MASGRTLLLTFTNTLGMLPLALVATTLGGGGWGSRGGGGMYRENDSGGAGGDGGSGGGGNRGRVGHVGGAYDVAKSIPGGAWKERAPDWGRGGAPTQTTMANMECAKYEEGGQRMHPRNQDRSSVPVAAPGRGGHGRLPYHRKKGGRKNRGRCGAEGEPATQNESTDSAGR